MIQINVGTKKASIISRKTWTKQNNDVIIQDKLKEGRGVTCQVGKN